MADNVIQFPKKTALFSQEQKARLAESVSGLCSEPEPVVERIEQQLCTDLVAVTREGSALVAEKLGKRFAKWIFGE